MIRHIFTGTIRKIKNIIRYPVNKHRVVSQLKKPGKKAIYVGASTSANIGDHALNIASKKFIQKYFTNYQLVVIPFNYIARKWQFEKYLSRDDLCFIIPGGNMGTLWPVADEWLNSEIKQLRNHYILVLPETYFYSNGYPQVKELIRKTKGLYNSCSHLHIFVRDKSSCEVVKSQIDRRVTLTPDMALMLKPNLNFSRKYVLTLMRHDLEKTRNQRDDIKIQQSLKAFSWVINSDMILEYINISQNEGKKAVLTKLKQFAQAKLVITDRLHGMIFSAITNTPCIVLKSKSYKVQGVYDVWLKENNFIKLIDSVDDLPKAIKEVMSVKNPKLKRNKINKAFVDMAKTMKKELNNSITY